eukprot:4946054-Amphidinium_carterae.1
MPPKRRGIQYGQAPTEVGLDAPGGHYAHRTSLAASRPAVDIIGSVAFSCAVASSRCAWTGHWSLSLWRKRHLCSQPGGKS